MCYLRYKEQSCHDSKSYMQAKEQFQVTECCIKLFKMGQANSISRLAGGSSARTECSTALIAWPKKCEEVAHHNSVGYHSSHTAGRNQLCLRLKQGQTSKSLNMAISGPGISIYLAFTAYKMVLKMILWSKSFGSI